MSGPVEAERGSGPVEAERGSGPHMQVFTEALAGGDNLFDRINGRNRSD